MTIDSPPKLQKLFDSKLINAPRINTHSQVSQLRAWCHSLSQWSQVASEPSARQQRDYFPTLPTTTFVQDNLLQSPQQPVMFLDEVKISQQVVAEATTTSQPSLENNPGATAAAAAPATIPRPDKTFYLADHIELATGELVFTNWGFIFPGPLNFSWFCRYRSSVKQDFGLGQGWLHPLCERLWLRPPSEDNPVAMIHYFASDGRYIQFAQPAIGEACVNRNEAMVLERLGSMNYRLIRAGQADRVFRTDGANPWLPLVEIRDAADNVLSIDYQNGQACKIVSSWGRVVEIHYRDNRISQLTSGAADSKRPPLAAYEYSAEGMLIRAWDDRARSEQYHYEETCLKQRQRANGEQLSFDWHSEQQRYYGVRQAELLQRYKWRAKLRRADISNSLGHLSRAQFDQANRLVEWIDAEGHCARWFYDSYGNLCSHTNPLGHTTHYRWDKCGRCVRQTEASGVSTHYRYDTYGNLLQVDNSAGQTWRRAYNDCGLLVAEHDPLGHKWEYTYNAKYLLQQLQDPEGGKIRLQWNSLAQLEQVTSQQGKVTRLNYDSAGQLIAVQQADQTLVEYAYDEHNRLQSVSLLGGEQWKIQYDHSGRILAIGLPEGFSAAYEYDDQGRCIVEKTLRGDKQEYRFDAAGHCVEIVKPSGYQRREYNRLGWLLATQNSEGRRQSFQYDAAGRLLKHRDMAVTVHIERNTQGKATQITNNSGEHCRYHYDQLSRLVLAENRWGSLRFQYDLCNKLVAEHQELELSGSFSFLHSYDKRGWHVNTNTDQHHIQYLTSPDGLLHGVDMNAQAVFRCDFDALGREIEWVHDELKTTITRDNHALQALETRAKEAAVVFKQAFNPARQSLLYCALKRHSGVKYPEQSQCDERGNLTQENSYTFNYDGWNNLITAESGDFKTYYRYDAFARRIAKMTTHRKSKNVRQSVFCWLGNHIWREVHNTPKGEDYYHYLRHPIHRGLLAFLANDKTYYYLNTPSLQPLAVLSRRGETLWHARYNEAGEYSGLEKKAKINSPWRALNAYYDIETQLYYLDGTYYSSKLGVRLQRSPGE